MFRIAQRDDSGNWSDKYRYTFAINRSEDDWVSKSQHKPNDIIIEYNLTGSFSMGTIKIIKEVSDGKE